MSQIESLDDFTSNYYDDELTENLHHKDSSSSKLNSHNKYSKMRDKPILEDATQSYSNAANPHRIGSHRKTRDSQVDDTSSKYSLQASSLDDSFQIESLSNVSKICSQVLPSGQ